MTKQNRNLLKRTRLYLAIIVLINLINPSVKAKDDVLDQAKAILESYYVDKLPSEVYRALSITEMLQLLKDPYTQYYDKENVEGFLNILNMKYTGIGIVGESIEMGIRVLSVLPDSPASSGGIEEGDIILMVDENELKGLEYAKAIEILNGTEGKLFELKGIRNGELIAFKLVPELISYPSVIFEVLNDTIGYIRISSFGNLTYKEFKNAIKLLRRRGVYSYILDLRNNPGGYIKPAADIAGFFVGEKAIMEVQDKLSGRTAIKAEYNESIITEPLAVLINGGSASAAEIVAAALKDYKRAVLIGNNTYGKGVAQSVFKLKDGSMLKATTLKFYSPLGEAIDGKGVKPDIITNKIDSKIIGQVLLGDINKYSNEGHYVNHRVGNFMFSLDLSNFKNELDWECYRQIVNSSLELDTCINEGEGLSKSYNTGKLPKLKYVEVPKTVYKIGERLSFKLINKDYTGRVQYRCVLYDEVEKKYIDLWNTNDNYYSKWKPRGNEPFVVGFPINKIGNYRISFYVKRADIVKGKTGIVKKECDSFLETIPIIITE